MQLTRRALLASSAVLLVPKIGFAQAWPSKPVTILVPFAAGGPTDFIARLLADPLSKILGQPVVIENRSGAGGNLGAGLVAEGEPDGYTLLHSTVAMLSVNPIMYPTAKFNPLRDFAHIGTTASLPNVLIVNPKVTDAKTVTELVALGKSKKGGLSFATFGNGTSPHILGSLFQKLAGFEAEPVSYRGSAPALIDVVGGRVDFLFDSLTTSIEQIKAGAVRGLAVSSTARASQLPDIPTMQEAGYPGFDLNFWFSLQVSAKTPKPIVARLQAAVLEATSHPSFADALRVRGAEPTIVKTAGLPEFVQSQSAKWAKVATDIGLTPE